MTNDVDQFKCFKNLSLSGLELGRQSGAMILAIRDGSDLIANPGSDMKIRAGQLLIALGSKEELARLRKLLGRTLIQVERINT